MTTLHVSVLDGDITVWVVRDGHAYPFESAQQAHSSITMMQSGDEKWTNADLSYDIYRVNRNVWWDAEPPALSDAPDPAHFIEWALAEHQAGAERIADHIAGEH